MKDHLGKIKSLQDKIEFALKESDFNKLAIFSTELENSVEALVSNSIYKDGITQTELTELQNLLSSVQKYQEETSSKFKDYTLKVSRKQKMHQAYKQ